MLIYLKKLARLLLNLRYYVLYYLKNVRMQDVDILMVSQDMGRGGSQTLLYYIAKEFTNKGLKVCVLTYDVGPMIIDYMRLCPVILIKKRGLKKIAKTIREKYGCTKSICNTILTGDAVKQLNETGYFVISLVHELFHLIQDNGLEYSCQDIAENARCIIFPSQYGYRDFKKSLLKRVDFKYKIRHQGLYLMKGIKKIEEDNEIRATYNIPKNSKIVLNVASANKRKGIDLFLETAKRMISVDDNIYFVWVGDWAKKYLRIAKGRNGDKQYRNVRLVKFIKNREFLYKMYLASDLLLLTSREEPFGSVVLEAFFAGTPVMAFDGCGGYMDVVKDGVTGLLIKPFDINEAVKKIKHILYDDQKLLELSINCRRVSEKSDFGDYCNYILKQFEYTYGDQR